MYATRILDCNPTAALGPGATSIMRSITTGAERSIGPSGDGDFLCSHGLFFKCILIEKCTSRLKDPPR